VFAINFSETAPELPIKIPGRKSGAKRWVFAARK
jgi:hypothetical protein